MKIIGGLLALLTFASFVIQTPDLTKIRSLYRTAPLDKEAALQLDQLMTAIDSGSAPVLVCYKGANEMIQAKYAFIPIKKLEKFNKGKTLVSSAFKRDSSNLEMRFIR